MLGGCNRRGFQFFEQLKFKTLQLFVPNSKRLGGYTQWVHFFLQKKGAHHSEDFFKIDHFKATRQKEHGHSYIRALFDKEPGYTLRSPSTKIQGNFKRRPSSSLCQTARGSRATPKWEYFFLQKGTHHAKISRSTTRFRSRKHSDDACSCSSRPKGTRRGFQSSTMKCSGVVSAGPTGYHARKGEDLV